MNTFSRLSGSITRLLLLPPTFIFAMIAVRTLMNPAQAAAAVGISLDRPLAYTILRVGFAGFPLGCSIFLLTCLFSSRRIITGLSFVAIMAAVLLVVRTWGAAVDGTLEESMGLIISEIVLLALMVLGLVVETRHKGHSNEPAAATTLSRA